MGNSCPKCPEPQVCPEPQTCDITLSNNTTTGDVVKPIIQYYAPGNFEKLRDLYEREEEGILDTSLNATVHKYLDSVVQINKTNNKNVNVETFDTFNSKNRTFDKILHVILFIFILYLLFKKR